jgi:hypothetical protein
MAKSNKKELLAEQRAALFKTLKARFEKNMSRHKGLDWTAIQAKLEANKGKLWSLNEMEETGGEPMLLVTIKKRANTFFVIVQPKVRKNAEAFAMTGKRWRKEKNINRQTARWKWPLPWASSF